MDRPLPERTIRETVASTVGGGGAATPASLLRQGIGPGLTSVQSMFMDFPPSTVPALAVTDIHMSYGKHAVISDLSLSLAHGSVTALVGENGAGKSTLLKGLAGFEPMRFGTFKLNGKDVDPSSPAHMAAVCSLLGQSIWLRGLTICDHFRLFASPAQCSEALDVFDIGDLADRVPATLSTGQLQRAELASIVVRPWDVLLLDEPEAGLDDDHDRALEDYLKEQLGSRAVVVATHRPDLLARVLTETIAVEA